MNSILNIYSWADLELTETIYPKSFDLIFEDLDFELNSIDIEFTPEKENFRKIIFTEKDERKNQKGNNKRFKF